MPYNEFANRAEELGKQEVDRRLAALEAKMLWMEPRVRALLKDVTFKVKFNANGATGSINSFTLDGLEEHTLPASSAYTYSGKRFCGWAFTAQGEVMFMDGQHVTALDFSEKSGDVTLYAVWIDIPILSRAAGTGTRNNPGKVEIANPDKDLVIDTDLTAADLTSLAVVYDGTSYSLENVLQVTDETGGGLKVNSGLVMQLLPDTPEIGDTCWLRLNGEEIGLQLEFVAG